MIENELQYGVTKSRLADLQDSLASLGEDPPEHVHPLLHKAQKNAIQSLIYDMIQELAEYEGTKK